MSDTTLLLPASLNGVAVVFDLDDTLFPEAEYVKSARREIARRLSKRYGEMLPQADKLVSIMDDCPFHGPGAFDRLYDFISNEAPKVAREATIDWMRRVYRSHRPQISLEPATEALLSVLRSRGAVIALITDGRIETQSLKFNALGLGRFIPAELVSISEAVGADKHSPLPFMRMERLTQECYRRIYVGDNPAKDFLHPKALGWDTVRLAHSPSSDAIFRVGPTSLPEKYMAQHTIGAIEEILTLRSCSINNNI
ncbi:MAG: HAD hydrolase-like protein [Pseudoflavonifractor sp.]|nr:HAD hydrolase-like protein [Alloprevotella sp.]MCM1117347.1 HAD hydrolase-like protein [Pseudoflavonifractor sp.]